MKSVDPDRYARTSTFSSYDPRAKIVSIFFFAVCVSLLQDPILLFISTFFMLCLLALSGVPAGHLARRYAIALPFILFAALTMWYTSGQVPALAMFLRISASVLGLVLLISTTEFHHLLKGLQRLHTPDIIIRMLMFTYRYISVFSQELARMKLARRAKSYKSGRSFLHRNTMTVVTNTIGMVLVRAYERGLRVLDSLKARAYDGRVRTMRELKFVARDCGFCAILIFMPVMLLCYQWGLVI